MQFDILTKKIKIFIAFCLLIQKAKIFNLVYIIGNIIDNNDNKL